MQTINKMGSKIKTEISILFDGRIFRIIFNGDLNESQIKREAEWLIEDIEQYIVEKWLDRKASSSRMSEEVRERSEQRDKKKLESQKHKIKVTKY